MTSTASNSMTAGRVTRKTTALGQTRALQPPLQKPRSALVSGMSVPICTQMGGTANSESLYLLSKTVHSFTHETQVKRTAKGRGEVQSALRDAWKSKFGKFEFFSSWVSLVRFHVLLRSVVGFIFYWLRHFNRSVGSLCQYCCTCFLFPFLGVVHLLTYFLLYVFVLFRAQVVRFCPFWYMAFDRRCIVFVPTAVWSFFAC